jgi:hypothetical protein
VTFDHWEKVSRMVVKAVADAANRQEHAETEAAKPSASAKPAEGEIPQTISRSEKRAQEIWKKARDEAAGGGDDERSGERAAYEALKQEYEKKGDHWVKKGSDRATPARRGHGRSGRDA